MNTPVKLILGVLAIATIAMTSFQKKTNTSVSSKIVGTWKMAGYYVDTNKNGKPDSNEYVGANAHERNAFMIFSADGVVLLKTAYQGNSEQNWRLTEHDNYLDIYDTYGKSKAHSVHEHLSHLYIQSLTSTELLLEDKEAGMYFKGTTMWICWKRQ